MDRIKKTISLNRRFILKNLLVFILFFSGLFSVAKESNEVVAYKNQLKENFLSFVQSELKLNDQAIFFSESIHLKDLSNSLFRTYGITLSVFSRAEQIATISFSEMKSEVFQQCRAIYNNCDPLVLEVRPLKGFDNKGVFSYQKDYALILYLGY